MKKRLNDTYFALNGPRYAVGVDTVFATEDAVAKDLVNGLAAETALPMIRTLRVVAFEPSILESLRAVFGEAVEEPLPDSYALFVENGEITIVTDTENGVRYAACAIASHYDGGICSGVLYNVPLAPFRGVKTYLPAEDKLEEFRRYIDFCMYYGYNTMVIEVGGAMEYKRHPQINRVWKENCESFFEYSNKTEDVQRSQLWNKDSIHIENGGGSYLSQSTVKELVAYARAHGLEVIPEVPSLSHADYLFAGTFDFAEMPEDAYPDTYCPSNPKSYEVLFDVLDEVIAVFSPKTVHIGHDEWYLFGRCEKCRQKTPAQLYAEDITKIHDYLAKRGIGTMLWGEKLLDSHFDPDCGEGTSGAPCGGAHIRFFKKKTDKKVFFRTKELSVYQGSRSLSPGEEAVAEEGEIYCEILPTHEAIDRIPKDVIAMNWYYNIYRQGDEAYKARGIRSLFGNFSPYACKDWYERIRGGVGGICISNWGAASDYHLQRKGLFLDAVLASAMLWNREYRQEDRLHFAFLAAHELFQYHHRDQKGPYVDLIHTTDVVIPHDYFGCGGFGSDAMFRLGEYVICYADGTEERVELRFGDHIGPDIFPTEKSLGYAKEATYMTDWLVLDGRLYYRWRLPVKGRVQSVHLLSDEDYQGRIELRSVQLHDN